MEREEQEGTRRFKRGEKMTHSLYCEKSAWPAHTSSPANQHPRRNLRRMSQKCRHNYTNTNQGICVSATLSAMDAHSAAAHTKSASSHLDLNLENILSLPFFFPAINNTSAAKKQTKKTPSGTIFQNRTSLQENRNILPEDTEKNSSKKF